VTSSRIVPMMISDNMLFPMEPNISAISSPCSVTSSSLRGPWWNSDVNNIAHV